MTDDQTPEQSPTDPVDPMGAEMISESDLDEVLSQASSLAADLSEEIGQDAGTPAPGAASMDGAPSDSGVEVGLDELERLVAATRDEVDGSTEDTTTAGQADQETADLAVPDFMSEFTEPEPPAPAAPEQPSPPAATPAADGAQVTSDPSLGIVATGTKSETPPPEPLGVVGTPVPAVAEDAPSPEVDDTAEGAPTEPTLSRRARLARAIVDKAGPILFTVCDRGVSLLERIDRPLQRIGQVPRRLVGWLAIATLGTSLVVLILSAF